MCASGITLQKALQNIVLVSYQKNMSNNLCFLKYDELLPYSVPYHSQLWPVRQKHSAEVFGSQNIL